MYNRSNREREREYRKKKKMEIFLSNPSESNPLFFFSKNKTYKVNQKQERGKQYILTGRIYKTNGTTYTISARKQK